MQKKEGRIGFRATVSFFISRLSSASKSLKELLICVSIFRMCYLIYHLVSVLILVTVNSFVRTLYAYFHQG